MKLGIVKTDSNFIKKVAFAGAITTASLGLTLQGALADSISCYGNTCYGP